LKIYIRYIISGNSLLFSTLWYVTNMVIERNKVHIVSYKYGHRKEQSTYSKLQIWSQKGTKYI